MIGTGITTMTATGIMTGITRGIEIVVASATTTRADHGAGHPEQPGPLPTGDFLDLLLLFRRLITSDLAERFLEDGPLTEHHGHRILNVNWRDIAMRIDLP